MAVHSKNSRIVINELSFTARLNTYTLGHSMNLGESTTFADEGNRFIPGLRTGSMELGGLFDGAPANSEIYDRVANAQGPDAFLVTVGPDGFAVGKPAMSAAGLVQNYDVAAQVAETVGFTVEPMPDDGVDWGVSLRDLTAATATANGTAVDNVDPISTPGGGAGFLHVTAASVADTLDVKIQHSVDNSVWVDLITFTQATAVTAERKIATGTVNRYVRATWTIAGTTPSFTFLVAFARR